MRLFGGKGPVRGLPQRADGTPILPPEVVGDLAARGEVSFGSYSEAALVAVGVLTPANLSGARLPALTAYQRSTNDEQALARTDALRELVEVGEAGEHPAGATGDAVPMEGLLDVVRRAGRSYRFAGYFAVDDPAAAEGGLRSGVWIGVAAGDSSAVLETRLNPGDRPVDIRLLTPQRAVDELADTLFDARRREPSMASLSWFWSSGRQQVSWTAVCVRAGEASRARLSAGAANEAGSERVVDREEYAAVLRASLGAGLSGSG